MQQEDQAAAATLWHRPLPLPALTGLRGVAALWVVSFHMTSLLSKTFPDRAWIDSWIIPAHGWCGVDLFFVLSGFVLAHVHADEFGQLRGPAVVRFARLRFFRVYPVNGAVLLLILGLVVCDPVFASFYAHLGRGNLSAVAFAKTAAVATRWYLPGQGDWNQPVWSLSAEIIGYMAFPALAWLMLRRRLEAAGLVIAGGALGALASLQWAMGTIGTNDISQAGSVPRMMLCFVAGMAVQQSWRHAGPNSWLKRRGSVLAMSAGGAIVGLCFLPEGSAWMPFCFAALVLSGLAGGAGPLAGLLSGRVAMFLGRISFPLYLIHLTIFWWVDAHFHDALLTPVEIVALGIGAVAIAIALASVVHELVELPAHRLGRRLAGNVAVPERITAALQDGVIAR